MIKGQRGNCVSQEDEGCDMVACGFFRTFTLALFLFMLTFGVAEGANSLKRPPANENNLWYARTDSDTVFVFVHGIFSDSRDAWYFEGDSSREPIYWPHLISDDPTFDKPSIYLAGFYTEFDSGQYSIRDAANELHQALISREGSARTAVIDKSNIIFITHSTGGIVARHMLVRHKDIYQAKRVGLLLYASLSIGARDATRLKLLAKLAKQRMGQELQWDHPLLVELDKDFRNLVNDEDIQGLVGQEFLENHFIIKSGGFLCFWCSDEKVLVERDSGGRYFGEPYMLPNTDHFSTVKPHGRSHPSHRHLQNFYREVLLKKEHPGCVTPPLFQLQFVVQDNESLAMQPRFDTIPPPDPNLSFKQDDPSINGLPIYIARQGNSNAHYQTAIRLPCLDQMFKARFTRAAANSFLHVKRENRITQMCFVRGAVNNPANRVFMTCKEAQKCWPELARNAGLALPCTAAKAKKTQSNPREWFMPNVIWNAKADVPSDNSGASWIVPSLETLNNFSDEKRPGFTEFLIRSDQLSDLKGVDAISHAIKVNGTPVLIDGWPGHEIRTRFDPKKGLELRFALQNLGFSGARNGRERISIDLRFLQGQELFSEVKLVRWYVALRDAKPVKVMLDKFRTAIWSGIYRSPRKPDKFEIFLMSSKDMKGLSRYKKSFDELRLAFEDLSVTAVLRPRLGDNLYHGVTLGLRLTNGQIRFTFDKMVANKVCRWVVRKRKYRNFKKYFRDDIYRFENLPRSLSAPKYIPCNKI